MENREGKGTAVAVVVLAMLTLVFATTTAALGVGHFLAPKRTLSSDTATLSLPVVFSTPGGLLEVASVSTVEMFARTSTLSIAGISMGTTVSEVRVPVTYRYVTELGKEWHAYMRNGKFLVIAPAVRPSLPVAIDTSKMTVQTRAGWGRFDAQANLTSLLQDISPELARKAKSQRYTDFEREQARKTVTEFAAKWLIKQEQWRAVTPSQITVYFSDEPIEKLRSFGPEFAGTL